MFNFFKRTPKVKRLELLGKGWQVLRLFEWQGSKYTYKRNTFDSGESKEISLYGGNSGVHGLHISIRKSNWRDSNWKKWNIQIQLNGGTDQVQKSSYCVRYFEDLPTTVFPLIKGLVEACNNEYLEAPLRWERMQEAEKRKVEEQLSGVLGMTSANAAIRNTAQKAGK